MHIRDPIHGAVEITRAERDVIDSPFYQRLRHVRQLGFTELAFPGATHTRHAHGIGAMFVATRLFDAIFREPGLVPESDRARLRQAVRLAALLHDLGHAPLSHPAEVALPARAALGLPGWFDPGDGGRATHEDMTLKLLVDSDLTATLNRGFPEIGAHDVAALLTDRDPPTGTSFTAGSTDWLPLLRRLVSSEMDADRMDYLLRDSLYTGVSYGKFDVDWIAENLGHVVRDGRAFLALQRRAIFAFEDFLLSRYHMFMSVYFHRTSVGYEEMLLRWFESCPEEYALPADPHAFAGADDVQLLTTLRRSDSPWARRIVTRRGYRAVYEAHPGQVDRSDEVAAALGAAGVDAMVSASQGVVSKYLGTPREIWVRTAAGEVPIEDYTPLFRRYADAAILARVYVPPEDLSAAETTVARALGGR